MSELNLPNKIWTILPYQSGDEHAAVALFNKVFNKPMSADHWLWKYRTYTAPFENVWLAKANGQMVGHYAAMPGQIKIDGRQRPILVAADVMVHPDFRRQGILTQLVQHAHRYWKEEGVSLVIGLPNEQWGSRLMALGLKNLFPLRFINFHIHPEFGFSKRQGARGIRLLVFLRDLWFNFQSMRIKNNTKTLIRRLSDPDPALKHVSDHLIRFPYYGIVRDEKWLTWRYLDKGGPAYEFFLAQTDGSPTGYLVFRLVESSEGSYAHIADLFTLEDDFSIAARLCIHAIDLAREAGLKAVISTAIPGTRQYSAFRRMGFLPGRHQFNVMTARLDDAIPVSSLENRTAWQLGSGEFDIV